ncbi:MAG: polyphenol oxidase family protein [Candidatus Krumholzibacteria bacterium]|nr:polyphenol oxidase family protein [Candidatus Krumholzibacteria bacterium]
MFAWIEMNGLSVGTVPALAAAAPRLRVLFSPRGGGVSAGPFASLNLGGAVGDSPRAVAENRRRFLSAIGADPRRIARCAQVHGARIAAASRGGVYERADGLVTAERDLGLVIGTADCFPVILHSPSEMVCAALHAGRSGAAAGILERGIALLLGRFRADPHNLIAVCGPGICGRCYEVGRDEAMKFPAWARRRSAGRWHIDLPLFIRRTVLAAGVREANWFDAGLCTSCSADRCFSHRRDGGRTGRHWTVATMTGGRSAAGRGR